MQARRFLNLQRAKRRLFKIPVSTFSIVLIGFAFIFALLQIFTITTSYECQYGLIWVAGWFDQASLFHIFVVSSGLFVTILVIRIVLYRHELNGVETLFQTALIGTLILVLIVQKAFLFPYASPSWVQFENVYNSLNPSQKVLLVEEFDPIDLHSDWKYDFPPPPPYTFADNPRLTKEKNLRLSSIFQNEKSPLWSEFKALKQCSADMNHAIQQWESNQETMNQYWQEFGDWYALNRGRYGE